MIFGPNDLAVFDLWSVIHFMAGGTIAGGTMVFISRKLWAVLLMALVLGFAWEPIEWVGETLRNQQHEIWFNRWIGDPVSVVFGAFFAWAVINWRKLYGNEEA